MPSKEGLSAFGAGRYGPTVNAGMIMIREYAGLDYDEKVSVAEGKKKPQRNKPATALLQEQPTIDELGTLPTVPPTWKEEIKQTLHEYLDGQFD